ncbi:MAG: rhomboid family intramembrane serine protease [Polyangia bacterium]|mgnify:CR=1 FL=1
MSSSGPGSTRSIWALIAMLWLGLFVTGIWIDGQASFPLWRLSVPTLLWLGGLLVPLRFPTDGWRIATAWLVHVDALHVLSNLTLLGWLGWLWPIRWSPRAPLLLGICSSGAATIFLSPRHELVSAGGSGVLLTLFATAAVGVVSRSVRARALFACAAVLSSGIWFSVDWAAHAGGLLAGLAWGFFQRRQTTTA